jgi:hypothetical protein
VSLWRDESGDRNPFCYPKDLKVRSARSASFLVEGSGDFPVDMLRYDRGRAMTPLPDPSQYHAKPFRVVVQLQTSPTIQRWDSFGWRVVQEVPEDARRDRRVVGMGLTMVGSDIPTCLRCQVMGRHALSRVTGEAVCETCFKQEGTAPNAKRLWTTMRHAIWHGDYLYDGNLDRPLP